MDQETYTAVKAFNTVNQRFEPGDTFLASDLVLQENGASLDDLRQGKFVARAGTATADKAIDKAQAAGRDPLVPGDDQVIVPDAAGETVNEAIRQVVEGETKETQPSKT